MLSTIGLQLVRSYASVYAPRAKHEILVPVLVINEVAEPRRVNDSQTKSNTILFNVCRRVRDLRRENGGRVYLR